VGAITGEKKQLHFIDHEACIKCDSCRTACRFEAVEKVTGAAVHAHRR
jgi:Fe-S-cluster-containing hydrogenase component 2